jgi:NADPH-dependent curcumin reductase CurA
MGIYRAIQLERFAPSFRDAADMIILPIRAPQAGEILVRNTWCGVNAIFDTQIARNAVDYVTVAPPIITGVESIGTVLAVGDEVSELEIGDTVGSVRFGGGYREANTAQAGLFAKMPGPEREWLALASTGVSALLALDIGEARAGDVVAVSAAAGGLGHFIVQLAKLRGCRVIAVCGGPEKGALVRRLGADRVIDHRTENVAEVIGREFKDRLDVAVDTVGGAIFDAFADNLAVHGRLVAAGAAQDLEGRPEVVTAPRIVHKLYYKGASIRGFMNGLLTDRWPAARKTLFELYSCGQLQVTFDTQDFCGLPHVYDAVEHLLSGRSMGKVVVNLNPSGSAPLQ